MDFRDRAADVFRPDLYREAVGEYGPEVTAAVSTFDDVAFSGSDIDAYLKQFALHTDFVVTRSTL
jgi:hypothetical protein